MTKIMISLSSKGKTPVEERWTEFCKEEKLHAAVKKAGLDYIKNCRFNIHDKGAVDKLSPRQIWNIASEHARGKY